MWLKFGLLFKPNVLLFFSGEFVVCLNYSALFQDMEFKSDATTIKMMRVYLVKHFRYLQS